MDAEAAANLRTFIVVFAIFGAMAFIELRDWLRSKKPLGPRERRRWRRGPDITTVHDKLLKPEDRHCWRCGADITTVRDELLEPEDRRRWRRGLGRRKTKRC